MVSFKIFKIKCFFRRKASPSIDKCGAKPRIFSQLQSQNKGNSGVSSLRLRSGSFKVTSLSDPSGCMVVLILIENAGHSPAFIYEAEGFVLKRFKRF